MNIAGGSDEGDKSISMEVWNRLLRAALTLPGARIDRAEYLRKQLSTHFPFDVVEQAIATRPAAAGIPSSSITSIAKGSIAWHRAGVSATSTVVNLPGGWWIAGSVPADLAQFYWHIVVVLQKLAYLYGWPEFSSEDDKLDDETLLVFTIFIGVMLGAAEANKLLGQLAERLGEQILKRLPQKALTKWGFYALAKQVAKWIGIQLTKTSFARFLTRVIPIVSGFICGVITWISFNIMSKRLRLHLESLRPAKN